jgi:PAS domain S-box-containing protein
VEKLDLAFRACPSALAISNLEDGRFVEVNPAFEALFGFSREEALGRSAKDLGLWTDARDFARLRRRLAVEREVRQAELELRRKSGETFWGALSAAEIELEGTAHLLAIVREIDAEVERERALEQRARQLCRATAAEAIAVLDERGSLSAWGRGAAHLLGWSAVEVVGRSARASFDPAGALDRLAAGGEGTGGGAEVELLHREGRRVRMVALRAAIGEARGEAAWLVVAKPRPAASKRVAPARK